MGCKLQPINKALSLKKGRKNMNYVKYGDKVKVTDWGEMYSTDVGYLVSIAGNCSKDLLVRFAFLDNSHYLDQKNGKLDLQTYIVLHVDYDKGRALISGDLKYGKVYCLNISALKPVIPSYTKIDLIKIVGSDFNLVDETTGNVIC